MFTGKREDLENILYKNQPLKQVACEVRFKGELCIESNRHIFQDKVYEEYPDLYVPLADPSVAPSLQHYRFQSSNGVRCIQIAINSISFYETTYSGYESFSAEFFRLFDIAAEIFKIRQFTRIGWRYINEISFTRENGLIPLGRFLKYTPKILNTLGDNYSHIDMVTSQPYEGVNIGISVRSVKQLFTQNEAIILDIDAYDDKLSDIKANQVSKHMDDLHYVARKTFEDFITEDFRTFLRGDIYE